MLFLELLWACSYASNKSLAFKLALRTCFFVWSLATSKGHRFTKCCFRILRDTFIILQQSLCVLGTESCKVWKPFSFTLAKHRYLFPLCSIYYCYEEWWDHTQGISSVLFSACLKTGRERDFWSWRSVKAQFCKITSPKILLWVQSAKFSSSNRSLTCFKRRAQLDFIFWTKPFVSL